MKSCNNCGAICYEPNCPTEENKPCKEWEPLTASQMPIKRKDQLLDAARIINLIKGGLPQ